MVYVDQMAVWPGKGNWCHMWADSLDELHDMAGRIGLKRSWFQRGRWLDHYDLRESKRRQALARGAVVGDLREVYREWRTAKRNRAG